MRNTREIIGEEKVKSKFGLEFLKPSHRKKEIERKFLDEWEKIFKETNSAFKVLKNRLKNRIVELKKERRRGKKIIGYFCNFTPEELIYASNSIPVRLCSGSFQATFIFDENLISDTCPLIKSSFGLILSNSLFYNFCDVIILPLVCDGKRKLSEILSEFSDVWILKIPRTKSEIDKYLSDLYVIKEKLENLTGNKINRKSLENSIKTFHKRTEVFREFLNLKKESPGLIGSLETNLIGFTSFFDDVEIWTNNLKKICENMKRNKKEEKENKIRILLTGSPIIFPNTKILKIIENYANVVVDNFCFTEHLYHSVEVDDWSMKGMMRALANKYIAPSICPCLLSEEDRIDRTLQLIEDFKVDGVIYYQLRNCQLFDLEYLKMRQVFLRKKIPIFKIVSDYSTQDTEQLRIRIETFIEMIKRGKK
ncbi:MAG: 2-hydroxyacyl-CoA dehydratase family protein [Candidatus Aenigmatarchaeota archaeon]